MRLRYDVRLIPDSRTADLYMLTFTPLLLEGRCLLYTSRLLSGDAALCTCSPYLWLCCLDPPMYISALPDALGTLSEFSSVPILVADELVQILIL